MTAKSEIRCETPRCIGDIAKHGERYHDVFPETGIAGVDAYCQRCGGKHLAAGGWHHACRQCQAVVQPGALTGLFVPHSCAPCVEKNRQADRARGAMCGRCQNTFTDCCC